MSLNLRPLFQAKSRFLTSALLFVATAVTSVAAHAACNLTSFTTRLQSTGTGPFNIGDVCTANGTAHVAGNDACSTDSVVRTSDTYVYRYNYKVLSGTREDNITFRSSLPLVGGRKVAVWDGLPSQCTGAGSSVSTDGLTLVCNIGTADRTGTGDLTSALLAQVKSTVYGANADQIAGVTGSISTDNCTSADNADQTLPVVEISARQKADFRKDVAYGQTAYTYNGVLGYLVGYYIYMDQYDPTGSAKGGQALNSPITIKDFNGIPTAPASSPWPAGAVWFDCFDATGNGQGTLSCPAQGTAVQNNVAQDLVLTARPAEVGEFMIAGGVNTSLGRNPNASDPQRLATFVARFFVPLSAINSAGGQLNLKNSIPAANIVGTAIDNAPIVDAKPDNNELVITVVGTLPGGIYKYVAAEWGYPWSGPTPGAPGTQYKQLQGTDNYGDSGTGLIFPGQIFYPRLDYNNPNVLPATNVQQCESFDSTKVRLVEISTMPGHAAADIYATPSDRGQISARFPQGYVTEYGVAAVQGGPGVNARCDNGDAIWFADLNAATAAGQRENLNRVRMTTPEVSSGNAMYFMIAQQARPNVNGTIIDDYYSAKASNMVGSNATLGDWVLSGYDKVTNNGVGLGKRFTLTTSLVRVLKEAALTETGANINQATAGGSVTYKLTPSLQTVIVNPPPTYITIVDKLPEPLVYVTGSAKLGGVVKDPDSISFDATGTTLTWTLNNVVANVPLPTLTFVADVPQTIPPNQSKVNSVSVSSPDDTSPEPQRTATKALTILNPPGLYVFKSVAATKIDPNGTARWKLQVSNFESSGTSVDIIDVLPFIGDARLPATNYIGTRGIAAAVTAPGGGTTRYTSVASASVVFDPSAPGNTATVGAGWCLEAEFGQVGCPANFAAVTAFRITDVAIGANTTVDVNFDTPTLSNTVDNIYTNRFYTKSSDAQLTTLRSNDVRVTVALGSIAGKVYVDTDRTATQNTAGDVGIGSVPITLCLVVPVNGACPTGQVAINPLTNQPLQTVTNPDGSYKIEGVPSSPVGGYFVVETRPAGYGNGPNNAPGSLGGTSNTNNYSAVTLPVGANGTNYNFGHTTVDLNTTVNLPTTSVAPGSTANGTVVLGNSSATDGENTEVTLTLTPNLAGVVITPPSGWAIAPGGAYDPVTGRVRLVPTAAGGIFPANTSVTVGVAFTVPETVAITVRSDISNTIVDQTSLVNPPAMTNPNTTDPTRNAHIATLRVAAMTLDTLKRVGTPRPLTNLERTNLGVALLDNAYMVPYRVSVANKGEIAATNVQLTDRLDFTFPAPATIVGVFQANSGFSGTRGAALSAGSHPNCQVSATAFDGVAQPNFLNGSFSLPALAANADANTAAACFLEFTVIVNYAAAPAPATALKNSTYASANNNPNNPGPTSFSGTGVPVFGAPGHRVSDISTDTPQIPAQPYPGGDYPTVLTPGSITANTDVPDPTPVILGVPQQVDVRKSASQAVQLDVSGRRFKTAYTVNLKNTGAIDATSVQLSENLRFTFASPALFTVSGLTSVSGNCPLNPSFDGGKTNTPAGYNMVGVNGSSTHTLTPGQSCVLSFVVDVDYGTNPVPAAASENRVFGSTAFGANEGSLFSAVGVKTGDAPNMIAKDTSANVVATVPTFGQPPADPGSPATANSDVGSSTLAIIKTLETIKSVRGPVEIVAVKKYKVPYTAKVTAIGTAGEVLPNVQAIDNLLQTFRNAGGATPTITVTGHQVPVASPAGSYCPSTFATFNGDSVQRLFPGNTPLAVGQSCEFKFDVIVDYTGTEVVPGPHLNTVYASSVPGSGTNTGGSVAVNTARSQTNPSGGNGTTAGIWTPPVGAIAIDASTDGVNTPVTASADAPLPTPVAFALASPITGIKYVENASIPSAAAVSGQDIVWTIIYKNEGPYKMTGVQVTDALHVGLSAPTILSAVKSPTPTLTADVPAVNTNYNGVAEQNMLSANTALEAGQLLTIKLKATIKPDFVGNLNNQAKFSATEYGGPSGQLTLTSAVNPDSPSCANTQACVPVGATVPAAALVSQPAGNTTKDQPNTLAVVAGGSISGRTWMDDNSDGLINNGEKPVPGIRVAVYAVNPTTGERLAEITNPTNRPVVDASGAYKVGGLSPTANGGPQYEVVFFNEAGLAILGDPSPMANGNPNNGQVPTSRDRIAKVSVTEGTDTPAQNLPLDPAGVVYDSITREPVPGSVVSFTGPAGFDPALHLVGGLANVTQTVGASGFYQYILQPNAPAGQYALTVVPPAAYVYPSVLIPAQAGALTPATGAGSSFPVQPQAGPPQIASNDPTTYYLSFVLTPGSSKDVVHNHIPLDPRAMPRLNLAKSVSKSSAELGEVVTYVLRVRNVGTGAAPSVRIADRLPPGFRYIPGTTRTANGNGAAYAASADPLGGVGPALTFAVPGSIAVNTEALVSYKVRIAVGSLQGDGINRARANSGRITSNEAQARVKVEAGVFTNEACVVGKVFVDCNNNHVQDAEELGIPGVRLYLQDGTKFITDSEGKYSYCGLPANSSVLKIDILSMPRGSRVTTTSNRNLGDGNSLYLDPKGGQTLRGDFAEGSCSNPVLEQVKARRTQGEVRSPQNEKGGLPAKKFEGKAPNYPQQGTDSADQTLVKPRGSSVRSGQ